MKTDDCRQKTCCCCCVECIKSGSYCVGENRRKEQISTKQKVESLSCFRIQLRSAQWSHMVYPKATTEEIGIISADNQKSNMGVTRSTTRPPPVKLSGKHIENRLNAEVKHRIRLSTTRGQEIFAETRKAFEQHIPAGCPWIMFLCVCPGVVTPLYRSRHRVSR